MTDRTTKVSLMAEVGGYIAGMQQANRSTKDLDKAGQEAAETARKQREVYDFMGKSLIAAGTMAIASAVYATKAAIDWETAWIGVEKVIDGTPAQIAAVEDELRALTRILPASHDEIAAVAEAAGRLGIEAGSISGFTKVMIDLGEATNITAEAAATDLARFLNVMGDSVDTVSNLGSAIVDLGNNFATSESEIVSMAMRLSGAGRQVGLTSAQVLGLATSLSAVGIEAEAGGSAISKVMIAIASEVANGGDRLETFARTAGMSAQEFSREWQTAPGEALAAFVQGLANAETQGSSALQVLEELGVTEVRMRDALLRSAAAADTFSGAMQLGTEAYAENNALAIEAEKRYASVAAQIDIARNSIVDAAIDFGQVFLPAVSAAATAVTDLATAIGEMPSWMQGTIAIVGVLVGVVALSGGAFILAVPKIAAYRAALATMGPVARGAATAVSTLNRAIAGLVVAAAITQLDQFLGKLNGGRVSANELAEALLKTSNISEQVSTALRGGASSIASDADVARTNLRMLMHESGDAVATIDEWAGAFVRFSTFGLQNTGFAAARSNIQELDQALATMVEEGNTRRAQQAFAELASYTDGSREELVKLREMLPEYSAAAREADRQTAELSATTSTSAQKYLEAADEVAQLENELRRLIEAINVANGVGQNAVTSNATYQKSIADVDEYIRQAREGVDGFSRSLDQSTVAGATNAAMFATLASEAQNAALAQFELDGDVNTYRESLIRARDAMLDQIENLTGSREAAEELADTIFQLPTEAEIEILVDTVSAEKKITGFWNSWQNRMITFRSDYLPPSGMAARADGGLEQYANGGVREGIYQGRPGGILKFAEPETGWEAFISGKPGKEARNRSVLLEAADRLGMGALMRPQSEGDTNYYSFELAPNDGRPLDEQALDAAARVAVRARARRKG